MTFRAPSTNTEMVDMVISLCRHSSLDSAQLKALHDAVHFAQAKAFGEGVASAFSDLFRAPKFPDYVGERSHRYGEEIIDAAAPPLIGERPYPEDTDRH